MLVPRGDNRRFCKCSVTTIPVHLYNGEASVQCLCPDSHPWCPYVVEETECDPGIQRRVINLHRQGDP